MRMRRMMMRLRMMRMMRMMMSLRMRLRMMRLRMRLRMRRMIRMMMMMKQHRMKCEPWSAVELYHCWGFIYKKIKRLVCLYVLTFASNRHGREKR